MSSTKRKYRPKDTPDYYVTPVSEIVLFLHALRSEDPLFDSMLRNPGTRVLDPCAGGDPEHPMSYPCALAEHGVSKEKITTLDIRPDSLAGTKGDYLTTTFGERFNVIITNPPFIIAEKVIYGSYKNLSQGGYLILLLRLNFFGGKRRLELWNWWRPVFAFLHSKRMSFTGDGKTDSIEYMHAVWRSGEHPRFTKLRVI